MDPATALAMALSLLDRATQWIAATRKAQAEGRDLNEAELDALAKGDDEARAKFQATIDSMK